MSDEFKFDFELESKPVEMPTPIAPLPIAQILPETLQHLKFLQDLEIKRTAGLTNDGEIDFSEDDDIYTDDDEDDSSVTYRPSNYVNTDLPKEKPLPTRDCIRGIHGWNGDGCFRCCEACDRESHYCPRCKERTNHDGSKLLDFDGDAANHKCYELYYESGEYDL